MVANWVKQISKTNKPNLYNLVGVWNIIFLFGAENTICMKIDLRKPFLGPMRFPLRKVSLYMLTSENTYGLYDENFQ